MNETKYLLSNSTIGEEVRYRLLGNDGDLAPLAMGYPRYDGDECVMHIGLMGKTGKLRWKASDMALSLDDFSEKYVRPYVESTYGVKLGIAGKHYCGSYDEVTG